MASDAKTSNVTPESETGDIARLTFFTDAAVAISLTLLILPVSDYINENPAINWWNLFEDNPEIVQYVTSFVVIVTCWRYHHVLFERLRDYGRPTVWLNFAWLFCVVSIPLMTLAILPAGDKGFRDYRLVLDTFFVRGEQNISYQNYFIYWFVIGVSFVALLLIGWHASDPKRNLSSTPARLRAERMVYVRPAAVCLATACIGLFNPAMADVVLFLGILTAVAFAWRSGRSRQSAN